jgi:GGDEF domain-containing protein
MLLFVGISRILPKEIAEESEGLSRTINLLGLAGAGSAVPFLLYNVSPAKCFLGDAGSMFFGLLLAVLGILTTQYYPAHSSIESSGGLTYSYLLVPWLVLFVPVADALRVTLGRMLEGKSPFRPDNRHLHHLLHRVGLSPNQILFLVGILVMIFGLIAAILVRSRHGPYLMIGVCLLLVYGLLWFLKSSYQARRFVTLTLNRRLLHFMEVTEGFENPATFKEHSEQELARARRHGSSLAVVVVNAMGLKLNSKTTNPMENPRFMENILRTLRREDVKCRFSSDRLAFILVETDKTLASKVCERLGERFDAVKQGESADLQVGIGFAIYPDSGVTIAALLQHAEAAALEKMTVGSSVVAGEKPRALQVESVPVKEERGALAPASRGANGSEGYPAPAPIGVEGALGIPAQASVAAIPPPSPLGEASQWPQWAGGRQEPLVPGAARGG